MGISLFGVSWLSLSVPCAGNAEGEEVFTLTANTEWLLSIFVPPSTESAVCLRYGQGQEGWSDALVNTLRPGEGVRECAAGASHSFLPIE